MRDRVSFTVEGNPIPKGRPRVTRKGHAYTPRRTREWEECVGWQARMAWEGPPVTGPLKLTMHFYRATAHRVDVDNMVKAVKDALNGIVYEDDSQVMVLTATKAIDRAAPRVTVIVEGLER